MITVNLYYTGMNGNARKFAQEMESSGTAAAIRAEQGNIHYSAVFTLERYGHVTKTMRQESANRMQAFIENM